VLIRTLLQVQLPFKREPGCIVHGISDRQLALKHWRDVAFGAAFSVGIVRARLRSGARLHIVAPTLVALVVPVGIQFIFVVLLVLVLILLVLAELLSEVCLRGSDITALFLELGVLFSRRPLSSVLVERPFVIPSDVVLVGLPLAVVLPSPGRLDPRKPSLDSGTTYQQIQQAAPLLSQSGINTFGDLEGRALEFPTLTRPAKRILNFHARQARHFAIKSKWMTAADWNFEDYLSEGSYTANRIEAWRIETM